MQVGDRKLLFSTTGFSLPLPLHKLLTASTTVQRPEFSENSSGWKPTFPFNQLLHTWSACPVGTEGHPAPLHPTLSGAQWYCGAVLPLPLPPQQQRDGMVSCCCPALPSTPGSDEQSPATVHVVWVNHRAFRLQWCPKCCFHRPPRTYHCHWCNICVEVSAPSPAHLCPVTPQHLAGARRPTPPGASGGHEITSRIAKGQGWQ